MLLITAVVWARTCKTADFSTQIRSGLHFRTHISYQSLGTLVWPTDISLTEVLMSGADGQRHFYHASFNTSLIQVWDRHSLPCCELPSTLCGLGRSSRSSYHLGQICRWEDFSSTARRFSCWASNTQVPVFPLYPGHRKRPMNTGIMLKSTQPPHHMRIYRPSSLSFSHFGTC